MIDDEENKLRQKIEMLYRQIDQLQVQNNELIRQMAILYDNPYSMLFNNLQKQVDVKIICQDCGYNHGNIMPESGDEGNYHFYISPCPNCIKIMKMKEI